MARNPPWRWRPWGPWPRERQGPPQKRPPPPIPEARIRPLGERLSKQRPWLSAEENWLAAEHALRQKPWRPWVIRFSGEKERSGWDWADLLLKVSVPVLILGLSTAYSIISADRQEKIARDQKESDVVTEFIKEMKPLLLEKGLKNAPKGSEVVGVARGLTLATLSRLTSEDAPGRRTIVLRYLIDSGVTNSGGFFSFPATDLNGADLSDADLTGADFHLAVLKRASLSWTNLRGANLIRANLSETGLLSADLSEANLYLANLSGAKLHSAKLIGADLSHADLRGADLRSAVLRNADLRGANLIGAFLDEADLKSVGWDDTTIWPLLRIRIEKAKNIPAPLRKQLGL